MVQKMKKLFSGILSGILMVTMLSSTAFAAETPSVDNIIFDVKSCNVTIEESTNDAFSYDYDSAKFDVNTSTKDSTMTIEVAHIEGVATELLDRVIIYIPNKEYDLITVNGDAAGVGLPKINANYDVNAINSAIRADIFEGYNKTMDINLETSSSSIDFLKGSKDFTLTIDPTFSSSCVVEFPNFTPMKKYSYTDGTGVAKINMTASMSSIKIKDNR